MDKTKYMTVATTQGDVSVPRLGSLQKVYDSKYLGSMMVSSHADLVLNRVAAVSQGLHISLNLSLDPAVWKRVMVTDQGDDF